MEKVQTRNKKNGILGLFAALTLALGVGVSLAPKEAVKTEAADFVQTSTVTSGNKYLITATIDGKTYYLPTGNHSSAPTATELNLSTITESSAWIFTGSDSAGFKIHDDEGYILYTTDKNNGVRSNQTSSVVWHKVDSTWKVTDVNNRRLALYETQDWRTYKDTTHGNQTIVLYELVTQTGPAPEEMELDVQSLSLDILDTHQLVPSFKPEGAIAGVSYSVTASNPAGVVSVTAGGLVTALKTGTAVVTATTTDGSNLSATVDVTVTGNYSSNIMTPAEAQELAVGADVIVRGKVVADIKNNGAYAIQVGDRGIMTYGINGLTIGNDVIIAGKMAAFNGMPQITNATSVIDLGLSTTTVTPKVISAFSELNAKLSGTLVQINGMGYTSGTFTAGNATNVTLKLGANDLAIRATKDVPSAAIDAANAIFNSAGPDDVLNVTTVAGWFDGAQLLFSEETVIEKIAPAFGALDRIELNVDNVVKTYYVGEQFSLSGLVVTAYDGLDLAKIVTAEATSSLAEDYEFVVGDVGEKSISISYEEGGVTKTASFVISVEPAPTWTKTTLAYGGSKTTNLVEDENGAEILGLAPALFDVQAVKGSASNNVGINKDGSIRLYWHADGGNILTVSVTSGKEIGKLVFKFGGTVAKAKIMVDTEEKYNAEPSASGTVTLENLKGSSFSIENVHESNIQLWISSIDIYYENASDPVYDETKVFADWMMDATRDEEACIDKFEEAESKWGGLSQAAKDLFNSHADFADAKLRLQNWAIANGVASIDATGPVAEKTINNVTDNSLTATIIIGVIGLTTLAGYYFLQKKKEA